MKKSICCFAVLCFLLIFSVSSAECAEKKRECLSVYLKTADGTVECAADAFISNGSVWVESLLFEKAGIPVAAITARKQFAVTVTDPSAKFDLPELDRLTGDSISLYFPMLIENDRKYFNVSGLQRLLGLFYSFNGDKIIFEKQPSAKAYLESAEKCKNASKNKKLICAWEHVTKENPDIMQEKLPECLDVIMPTWFNLDDGAGSAANRASRVYSDAAHMQNTRVWALVTNSFNAEKTTKFFADSSAMDRFIARLLIYCRLYDLDGINIDFEGMNETHRSAFVNFMMRLNGYTKAHNLTLSVDVGVPGKTVSSSSYDRASLSKYADYIMLMAYDEHWRTCKTAGSVASLPWVKVKTEETLADGVPDAKLILGVPFYMREWEETKIGNTVKVRARTLTMAQAAELAQKKGAVMKWLDSAGQYYFSYLENGKTIKVWVENRESLQKKAEIMQDKNLAGISAWRLRHETGDVWNMMKNVCNN